MSKVRLLSKEDILAAKPVTEEVQLPELGGAVLIRGLSGAQRDEWEAEQVDPEMAGRWDRMNAAQKRVAIRQRMRNMKARLVSRCAVDEEGNRMFSDSDVEQLGEISAAAIARMYAVAARLSGLRDQDLQEMVEDIRDNPTDDSSSGSA